MNVGSGEFLQPRLEGDRLVADRIDKDRVWQRITAVKSGLLVCSYALPLQDYAAGTDQPVLVKAREVARLLVRMTAFGWRFFESLKIPALVYEWSLEDCTR